MKDVTASVKVIYVAGSSRSGSTVIDSLLGSYPDLVGTGELDKLHQSGWTGNDYCGCGLEVRSCPVWEEVREKWEVERGFSTPEYLTLQASFSRLRQIPSIMIQSRLRRPRFIHYLEMTRALFEVITEVSGVSGVVDSSKSPVRAMALSLIDGVDLNVIHRTRDSRGVATSLMKSWKKDPRTGIQTDLPGLPVSEVIRNWNRVNDAMTVVDRFSRSLSVRHFRYEDFLHDPCGWLDSIGDFLGKDFAEVASRIDSPQGIPIGHTVAGNRLRMSRSVTLREADPWSSLISASDRASVESGCSRLMNRYGYSMSESPD